MNIYEFEYQARIFIPKISHQVYHTAIGSSATLFFIKMLQACSLFEFVLEDVPDASAVIS